MDLLNGVDKIYFSFGNVHDARILAQKSHSLCLHSPSKLGNAVQISVCFKQTTGNRRLSLLGINDTGQL